MTAQIIDISDWYALDSETITIGDTDYILALVAGGFSWGLVRGEQIEILGSGLEEKRQARSQILKFVKKQQLVVRIKQWANDNYEKGGSWIVETMSDREIGESFRTMADAKSYAKRIKSREQECQGW